MELSLMPVAIRVRPCRLSGRPHACGTLGVLRSAPVVAAAAAVLIWGTTFVVSDTALASMSPAALTVGRFVLALLVLGHWR
jgi:hypothetical protein